MPELPNENNRAMAKNTLGELKMTETPKCPYCGAEMELKYVCGEYFCLCAVCEATSPMGTSKETVLSAALHRAEPENRVLTLDEVKAHCAKGPDAEPLWTEFREKRTISRWIFAVIPPDVFDRPVISEWIATDRSEKYGKIWRCWPRKPTPEQMQAAKWEE